MAKKQKHYLMIFENIWCVKLCLGLMVNRLVPQDKEMSVLGNQPAVHSVGVSSRRVCGERERERERYNSQ